jgi:hypothetical protein
MARTAVVAGTASAVAGGVQHRQQARYADKEQAAAAAAAPAPDPNWAAQQQWAAEQAAAAPDSGDMIAQLKDLAALHEQGVLTDAEFAVQKDRLLNG